MWRSCSFGAGGLRAAYLKHEFKFDWSDFELGSRRATVSLVLVRAMVQHGKHDASRCLQKERDIEAPS